MVDEKEDGRVSSLVTIVPPEITLPERSSDEVIFVGVPVTGLLEGAF